MKRRDILYLVPLLAAGAACAKAQDNKSKTESGQLPPGHWEIHVEKNNLNASHLKVTVKKGEKVKWSRKDGHTNPFVVFFAKENPFHEPFDAPLVIADENEREVTFDPGTVEKPFKYSLVIYDRENDQFTFQDPTLIIRP